jgi:hypothetical protein
MATTEFTNGATLTDADWFDDVDAHVYEKFGATGGLVCIGDTSNANMTLGLTINQGAADDAILALKSSDVAHGITDLDETDTFGRLFKQTAASGGLGVRGYTELVPGMEIQSISVQETTTKSAAADGAIMLHAFLKNGTTTTTLGASTNLAVIKNAGNTRFIFDSDGDSHQDVGTAWTNFDAHNDVALLDATSALLDPSSLRRQFTEGFLQENKQKLQDLKIVQFNEDGHHFINWSRFQMLHMGATRWMAEKLEQAMAKIEQLETKLLTRE